MADHHLNGGALKRIAIVAPSAWSLIHGRDRLVQDISSRGHEVLCLAPDFADNDKAILGSLGAQCQILNLEAASLPFFTDRKIIAGLQKTFSVWRPDVVLGYGARTFSYAAFAAKKCSVRRIISLMNVVPEFGFRPDAAGSPSPRGVKRALEVSDAVVFHNKEHAARLRKEGLLSPSKPVFVVPGAGVDVERSIALPLPPLGQGLVFLMLSRLERSRGVGDFAEAARKVKSRSPASKFLLAGPPGAGTSAVTPAAIGADGENLIYAGEVSDVRSEIAKSHVFVYPSRAEGMPRAVQEALAAGRPVIVADVPGSRETVDERVNGCLVEPGNADELAGAMESFLMRPDLIPAMARASRLKAERKFDVRDVNASWFKILEIS
jgi:glycosyltransferase involved in cell wall biosynthesis